MRMTNINDIASIQDSSTIKKAIINDVHIKIDNNKNLEEVTKPEMKNKDNEKHNKDCTCGLNQKPEKEKKSSKISMSYAKLKKRKQKSTRKSLDKKNRQLLAKTEAESNLPPQQGSWLLRLFESKLFDIPMAISYLYTSKESGVLAYLGNKLFVSICFLKIFIDIVILISHMFCDIVAFKSIFFNILQINYKRRSARFW